MAKKPQKNLPTTASFRPWGFAMIGDDGIAPDSRVQTANDAFTICKQLRTDNIARETKWSRIFRCYNLFPPNSYSKVAGSELFGSSNVPWGQMKYRVDNKKSPYFDMVMQRNQAANITTKEGSETDRKIFSEIISEGWDRVLRKWMSYRYNTELTIQEMLLYGKGFEFMDEVNGWFTASLHNYNVLIPNDTYANLRNLGEICLKRSYTPIEFWAKIKDQATASAVGWNFWACVNALRFFSGNYQYYKTLTEFLHAVDSQSTILNRVYNLKINVYELYIKEYDGSITKTIALQDYGPIVADANKMPGKKITQEDYMENMGYLFVKKNYAKTWDELITPFICSSGSGFWHEIKGFAEGIYSQCRAHDIHMNKMMTSVLINNTFMLKGGSAEATKKLKQMEWTMGGMTILPSDTEPVQNRWEMPIGETIEFAQYYTTEMDRGTGTYQINAQAAQGGSITATQDQNNVMESAKLQGTEIRGYNDSQTRWQRMMYRRMCETTRGGDGFELKEEFMEFMDDNKVPKDAWQYDNLQDFESNMLGGAASPSYKLMAADKLIVYAGMTASNPGQENAIQDGIAALADRQNVARYRNVKTQELPKELREIGMENSALTNPDCNPENVRVLPADNHLEHIKGHFSDAMAIGNKTMQGLQQKTVDAKSAMDAHQALLLHGGHMQAHLQYLEQDPTKKTEIKQIGQGMQQLQKLTDEVGSAATQMQQSQQGQQGNPADDQKVQTAVALSGIEVNKKKQLAQIDLASKAQKAQLANEASRTKTATQIASERAKTNNQIDQSQQVHQQDLQQGQDTHTQNVVQSTVDAAQQLVQQNESHQLALQQEQESAQNDTEAEAN